MAIKSYDLTQEEAAEKLGIARQTLNSWFKKPVLSDDLLQKVNDKLGIKLDKMSNLMHEPDSEYVVNEITNVAVPIYMTEFAAGTMKELIDRKDVHFPVGYLSIPEVSGCDAIIRNRGESMSPRIRDGDWLGIKYVDNWQEWLAMDYIYAIETDNFQLVRNIKKGSKGDTFKIISFNKEYDEDEIPKKVIRDVWAVKTILPIGSMETLL